MTRSLVLGLFLCITMAGTSYGQQVINGCPILPADNIWNTPIESLPVLPNSGTMVSTIGASRGFHADFGAGTWDGGPIGIPFITVSSSQLKYPASFLYADESDRGPYAIPMNVPIEGGSNATGDRHALALDTDNCLLYELFRAFPGSSSWTADSGAIFDLRSHALRPATWTSADAAGLPILPGLVTYDEVQSGEIRHAIRFTAPQTRREFVWPARHYASSLTGTQYPRMGERLRLKASFDISPYPADVQVILRAMKKYGIILADNGSAWFISGKPDSRWNDDNLRTLGQLLGSHFEAVDATVLRISADSGAAIQSGVTVSVSPATASVRIGQSQTFSATVTGAPTDVTWRVNDVTGGNALVGTISSDGRYIPPSTVPDPGVVVVRAVSTASPGSSGSASVTILAAPVIASISPSSFPIGPFSLTVDGAGFSQGSVVSFNGSALPTTFVSAARLNATGSLQNPQDSVPVSVTTPDGASSNVVFARVTSAPMVSVSVSPATATVRVRTTQQFIATVTGAGSTGIIWKVNGVTGGNGTIGTVSTTGLYRAPKFVPVPSVVAVSATVGTASSSSSVAVSKR
jgi:uncharacterized protein YjdB